MVGEYLSDSFHLLNQNTGTLTFSAGYIGSTNGMNQANNGGGIFVAGTVKISGGTIMNNKAASYGGGIYVYSGTVEMTNGTIGNDSKPNIATNAGGGVCQVGGTFTLSGGITGTTTTTITTTTKDKKKKKLHPGTNKYLSGLSIHTITFKDIQ